MEMTAARPRVVIVGAGFGGLNAAAGLSKAPVDVVLIDRHNYHTFQPLLYQVATAGLEPEEIAHAVRGVFQKQRNVAFRLGTVVGIDPRESAVLLDGGARLSYDYLVLAVGADTNYFGVTGADTHSFSLKTLPEATALRSHIIRQFELADQNETSIERGALTFVVVGGGPTGVETAGALVELFQMVLQKDFRRLPVHRTKVILVEARETLFSTFHEKSRMHVEQTLRKRGVDVRLNTTVVRVEPDAVTLNDGNVVRCHTVIWAAGVKGIQVADSLGVETTPGGRILLNEYLNVPSYANVFVVGDLAASRFPDGSPHPQLAPVAIQGGRYAAREIVRLVAGKPRGKPFQYRDKGIMATVGRNSAVAELAGGIRARGFLAWLMWLFLHLIMLIGFRNRLNVLVNWAWNYFTYDRSARLILDPAACESERKG